MPLPTPFRREIAPLPFDTSRAAHCAAHRRLPASDYAIASTFRMWPCFRVSSLHLRAGCALG